MKKSYKITKTKQRKCCNLWGVDNKIRKMSAAILVMSGLFMMAGPQPTYALLAASHLEFKGNEGSVDRGTNDDIPMVIKGNGTKENSEYDPSNIKTYIDGDGNMIIGLDKNLHVGTVTANTMTANTGTMGTINTNTITAGDTQLTTNGITISGGSAGQTISLTQDGLDNGGKVITHVAAGAINPESTDAVNGSQLYQLREDVTSFNTSINRLDHRMNRVGAGAAALAGLHPLDFNPDDKWDFAVGYGNYKDAHAVAVGAFYRPNEDTMFSVGGSFGGGENMVNTGITFKLGQKNSVSRSRVALAKDVLELKQVVAKQDAMIKKQNDMIQQLMGNGVVERNIDVKDVNFSDVPKNHWAYDYVKTLADRGYLNGYPDGEFKGDRSLSRYEYAAIIYRALQNGAPGDARMAKAVNEFGPELEQVQKIERFRVDRISGKDNDRHKVERVRINDKGDKAQNDYRDVYGTSIQNTVHNA